MNIRLIDADKFVEALIKIVPDLRNLSTKTIGKALELTPTVDAVPVIRCKDCKYWLPHSQFGFDEDNEEYHNYCERLVPDDDYYAFIREADDYCSRAERKEE